MKKLPILMIVRNKIRVKRLQELLDRAGITEEQIYITHYEGALCVRTFSGYMLLDPIETMRDKLWVEEVVKLRLVEKEDE